MWDDLAAIDPRFAYTGERTPLRRASRSAASAPAASRSRAAAGWSTGRSATARRCRATTATRTSPSRPSRTASWSTRACSTAPMTSTRPARPACARCSTASATAPTARRWSACRISARSISTAASRPPTSSSRTTRFPGGVRLTALSPFIPHNDRDSSMPVAMFEFELVNDTGDELTYTLAGTLGNYGANSGIHTFARKDGRQHAAPDLVRPGPAAGRSAATSPSPPTPRTSSTSTIHYRGQWFDDLAVFWKEFARPGRLPERHYDEPRAVAAHEPAARARHARGARHGRPPAGARRCASSSPGAFRIGDIYWAFRNKPDAPIPDKRDADLAQLLRDAVGRFRRRAPATRFARWDELAGADHRLPRRRSSARPCRPRSRTRRPRRWRCCAPPP